MNRSVMLPMITTRREPVYVFPLHKSGKAAYCLAHEYELARTHPRRMARHASDTAHVDTSRRQDSIEANTAHQSLVERAVVRYGPRPNHFADVLPGSHL